MIRLDFGPARRRKIPVFYSGEATECGLACLGMVAAYLGNDVDLNGLRQRFPVSLAGMSIRGIISVANAMGINARPLRAELSGLRKMQLPAILHWDFLHYVVLAEVGRSKVVIHDPVPGVGRRSMAWDEVSKHFTGIVVELTPREGAAPLLARTPVNLRRLWVDIIGLKRSLLQIAFLSLVLQVLTFGLPLQMQLSIDNALSEGSEEFLAALAATFSVVVLVQTLIEIGRNWTLEVISQLLSYKMMGNLLHHLLSLPSDYFEKRSVGDLASRIGSARTIQETITQGVATSLIDAVTALALGVVLFAYSPALTGIAVGGTVLILLVAFAASPMIRVAQERRIAHAAAEQTNLMETIRASSVIKTMGIELEREASWRNRYASTVNATVAARRAQIGQEGLQKIIAGLQTVWIVYIGVKMVLSSSGFTIGMLATFLVFRQIFTDRIVSVAGQVSQIWSIRLHLERISDITNAQPDESVDSALPEFNIFGGISLDQVTFRYGTSDRNVLEDANLDIKPGEFVAFTGLSGGGKTTLMKLMLGLNQPSAGRVLLDGVPADGARWRAWRQQIGVVAQDDSLFSGTIAENISFFDPDMKMSSVEEAARMASIHQDIDKLPMQYRAMVGDMGSALSGGQRQRILLARALYRKPKIIFLDEGTANLDIGTEENIASLLADLPMTKIVVAHRPALIDRADRVFVVHGQRVIDTSNKGGLDAL